MRSLRVRSANVDYTCQKDVESDPYSVAKAAKAPKAKLQKEVSDQSAGQENQPPAVSFDADKQTKVRRQGIRASSFVQGCGH